MNIEFLKQRECQAVLNLNNLGLNEFSEDIESIFPQLQEIQLSHNNIQQLDRIQLKSVEQFKAGFNSLQNRINVKMPNLKYLDLQYNMIQELNILSRSIQVLNLQKNLIETVDFIKNLKDLRILNLSQNKIKKIDFLIFNTKLEELNISNNSITNLSNAFINTPNLQILNISNNEISDVKFIDKLPELQELYASNNNIIQLNIEQKNENLNILDLSNNIIEEIEVIEFKFPFLTHFYIQNNQLYGEYQFNFMKLMKYVMVIDFKGNPFVTEEYEDQFIIDCPWIEMVNQREVQKPAQYVNYEIQELKNQLRNNGYLDDNEQPIVNSNEDNSIAEERIKAIMNLYQSKEDEEKQQIDSNKVKQDEDEPMTEENFVSYITQQNEEIDKIRALYRHRMEKKQKGDQSNITQNQEIQVETLQQKQEETTLDNSQRSKPTQVTRVTKIRNSSQLIIKSIPRSTPKQNAMNEIAQLKAAMKSKDFYEQLGFTNSKMNHSSENFHNSQNSSIRSKSKQKLQSATLKLPKI